MVAFDVARGGFLDEHVKKICEIYGERRNFMLNALETHFPPNVHWTRPEGGMFLWVTLPESLNAQEVLKKAVERKVALVPGGPFHATGGGENTMRLNFSNASPEKIQEGISRLGQVLYEAVGDFVAV
jgi:DNA-binding transcriptional MocR family regulator